jgi:hypothetical protein
MNLTTILVCTRDDIDVSIRTYGVQGNVTNLLNIGEFEGSSGIGGFPCRVVNLGMQIPAISLFVSNLSAVIQATFFVTGMTHN